MQVTEPEKQYNPEVGKKPPFNFPRAPAEIRHCARLCEKTLRSGERLQRRTCTQLKRQLRTVESAADRLERLPIQRRRERYRQLRTVDRESADARVANVCNREDNASVI